MFKNLLILFVLSLPFNSAVFAQESTAVRIANDLVYLNESQYESLKKQISPPPTLDSKEQKDDIAEMLLIQKNRTKNQCERAELEVKITFKSFVGPELYPFFTLDDDKIIDSLLSKTRGDVVYFSRRMKKDYPRERPYNYIPELKPCVHKETSLAYPSGHSTMAKAYAGILGELYPKFKSQFDQRANEIAQNRVLAGVHHPSDIVSGKKLGNLIFQELMKSGNYQKQIEQIKTELAALKKN